MFLEYAYLGTETVWVLGKLNELIGREIDSRCGTTSQSAIALVSGIKGDVREIVDHDWDGRGVHDLLEEAKNSLSVASHRKCKVSWPLMTVKDGRQVDIPGQMTIE